MKKERIVNRDKKSPTFLIELWDGELYKEIMSKQQTRRMWTGVVEHVQTAERKPFNHVDEMLAFIRERRV